MALDGGKNQEALLELVRRYKEAGLGQRAAYDALQELWHEYGFNDDAQQAENNARDNLEHVMEIVWGYSPSAGAIWPTSLSREKQPT